MRCQYFSNVAAVSFAVMCHPTFADLTAQPDARAVPLNTPVLIDVLNNDAGTGTLRIVSIGQPQGGTAVTTTDGGIRYQPRPGFVGQDSFYYTVSNTQGEQAQGRVTVTVADGIAAPANMAAALPALGGLMMQGHRGAVTRFTQSGGATAPAQGGGAGDALFPNGGVFLSIDQQNSEQASALGYGDNHGDTVITTMGFDLGLGQAWAVGGALGLSYGDVDSQTATANAEHNSQALIAFTSYGTGQWLSELQVGYAWNHYEIQPKDNSVANVNGHGQFVYGKLEYQRQVAGWQVSPGVGIDYQQQRLDGFGVGTVQFGQQRNEHFIGLASLRFDKALNYNWGVITPQLELVSEYCMEQNARTMTITGQRALESAGNISGDKHVYKVNVGAGFVLQHGWSGFVSYSSREQDQYLQQNSVSLGARWEF